MSTTPPPTIADGAWTSLRLPWDRDTDPLAHAWLGEAEQLIGRLTDVAGSADALAALFDPDQTPVDWIDWVAQLAGVSLVDVDGETARRRKLAEAPQRHRGTVTHLRAAARRYMTGDRVIQVDERTQLDGTSHRDWVRVRTYEPETPDPDQVEQALRAAKPADVGLAYETQTGATYDELSGEFATYDDLTAAFDDYDAMKIHVPPQA